MSNNSIPLSLIAVSEDCPEATPGCVFGGQPKLGTIEWPRNALGFPLHFVMQLDLAQLAGVNHILPLPKAGSLALFLDQEDPKGLEIAYRILLSEPSEIVTGAPNDILPIGHPRIGAQHALRLRQFPRFGLRIAPLHDARGRKKETNWDAMKEHLPRGAEPWLWHSMHLWHAKLCALQQHCMESNSRDA